jgi:hypothetical protein
VSQGRHEHKAATYTEGRYKGGAGEIRGVIGEIDGRWEI